MTVQKGLQIAHQLIRSGRPDDEVERLTGVSLIEIIGLRAALAAQSFSDRLPATSQKRWGSA